MRRSIILVLAALVAALAAAQLSPDQCRRPPLPTDFTPSMYEGRWYEIGKIQTRGGAFYQRNCFCTTIVATFRDSAGNGVTENLCNNRAPDGRVVNATGILTPNGPPGRFLQEFPSYGSEPVDYNVIFIGPDYSVEYDCGEDRGQLGTTEYCIHILSRTRTMNQTLFDELVSKAIALDLNPYNLPVEYAKQDGCDRAIVR